MTNLIKTIQFKNLLSLSGNILRQFQLSEKSFNLPYKIIFRDLDFGPGSGWRVRPTEPRSVGI